MDEQVHASEQLDDSQTNGSVTCASCQEYLSGWKRAQADYQNLQRERERERVDLTKYANERLLRELLPVFDQFRLAMSFLPSTEGLPEEAKRSWDQWLVGIKAVQSLWDQAATQTGLERISTEGLFDPQFHDAVAEEPSDQPEGTVLRVVQPGWKLHGRVLQAARVILAKSSL